MVCAVVIHPAFVQKSASLNSGMERAKTPISKVQSDTKAGERGYTLQTLIVTAVAVLLAVAAGVVIIAVTRSARDDFEGTPADLQGQCKPWEIYDPTLAAAGAGGGVPSNHFISGEAYQLSGSPGVGGVTSSAIGCLAPCYLIINDLTDATLDLVIQTNREYSIQKISSDNHNFEFYPFQQGDLKFDTSNRLPRYNLDLGVNNSYYEVRVGVVSEIGPNPHEYPPSLGDLAFVARRLKADTYVGTKDEDGNINSSSWIQQATATGNSWDNEIFTNITLIWSSGVKTQLGAPLGLADPPVTKGANVAIRAVAAAQACDIYDTATNEVLASSQASRVGSIIP